MNIFILDTNPAVAATFHNNSHVLKMTIESAQILSTAHYLLDGETKPLKPTHVHHPCVKWVIAGRDNYDWLFQLFTGLLNEYTRRYGKIHSYQKHLQTFEAAPRAIPFGSTPFAQCVPEAYLSVDPVDAYRSYYIHEKRHLAKWKTRTPHWYV